MFSRDQMEYRPIPLPDRIERADDAMLQDVAAFHAVMSTRHTVRDFSSRPVALQVIRTSIATGRSCAKRSQPSALAFFRHRERGNEAQDPGMRRRKKRGPFMPGAPGMNG